MHCGREMFSSPANRTAQEVTYFGMSVMILGILSHKAVRGFYQPSSHILVLPIGPLRQSISLGAGVASSPLTSVS